jgi:hypothetical protein
VKKSLMSLFCVSLLALLPACWGDKKPCCGSHCESTTETTVEEVVTTPTEQTEAPTTEATVVETVETTTEEAK